MLGRRHRGGGGVGTWIELRGREGGATRQEEKKLFCITDNQIDDSNSMQLLTHYEYYSLPLHTTITKNTTTTTATRALRTGRGVCGTTNSSSSLSGDGSARVKKGFGKKGLSSPLGGAPRTGVPSSPAALPPSAAPAAISPPKNETLPLSIPLVLVAALRGGE